MKYIKTSLMTMILTVLCAITAFAGTWEPQEKGGYKYKNDDGTYLADTWLQENGKWYFFGEDGLMTVNASVEGYQLGDDGAELSGIAEISSQYPRIVVKETVTETKGTDDNTTVTYVLNKNSKKFHKPSCSSVGDMAAKNRLDSTGSRDEVVAMGYAPCKRCKP